MKYRLVLLLKILSQAKILMCFLKKTHKYFQKVLFHIKTAVQSQIIWILMILS